MLCATVSKYDLISEGLTEAYLSQIQKRYRFNFLIIFLEQHNLLNFTLPPRVILSIKFCFAKDVSNVY